MEDLTTAMDKQDIFKMINVDEIEPNSFCIVHLKNGESVFIGQDLRTENILKSSGEFYRKQFDWITIQLEKEYTFTGNKNYLPFK